MGRRGHRRVHRRPAEGVVHARQTGKNAKGPDSRDIQAELDKLKARTQPICALADPKIAHSIGEPIAVPKYGDVDDASESIATLVRRYIALFHATSNNLEVVFQYDWKKSSAFPGFRSQ